jgi:hypothetical protein
MLLRLRQGHRKAWTTAVRKRTLNSITLRMEKRIEVPLHLPEFREQRGILAAGSYTGEGFDDARLDTSSWPCRFLGKERCNSRRPGCNR